MAKRKAITATELIEQLAIDPEYQQRKATRNAEIDELAAVCRKDEAALARELSDLGLPVTSVWDLVNNAPHAFLEKNFTGNYEIAYPTLVKHLRQKHHHRIREGIIRALSEKAAKDIASAALLEEFEKEQRKSLRWALANALFSMLSKSEVDELPGVKKAYEDGYL